ncbi:cation-transporting P-type ATPase [Actinotalea sp. M2MS4P-6]|uniref:cation-translocating P-type ATPase n=1 Tax=Actinotalea sp. M2MS4P-6 TaxID=2983762 RepID=UPI0021E4E7AA|nr:cation-transporting P-type ATPase [Actinotalea sp. M2MS4P-6]MCV2392858.1 cation-transporting P-type ATPase [Actinotalea sp. M2MS4P-6]
MGALPGAAEPWSMSATEVAAEAATDPAVGLTATTAADRLAHDGPNEVEPEPPVPTWRRFLAALADPLVVLLLVAVVVAVAVWLVEGAHGLPIDALVIAAIVVANAVLGLVQERRAEGAVEALATLSAARATVLRDGEPAEIPAREVVVGDVLLLAEGDRVAADGRLVTATALAVDEASLTGESTPVDKDPAAVPADTVLAERACLVLGGSPVLRGTGRAVVTATGADTETGRIAELLEHTAADPTPLQREMGRVGRSLGFAVAVIAVVVVIAVALTSPLRTPSDAVAVLLLGVSLAVAAVPEGLPAVLSVVLAIGVQRMARRHAIVTRLSSVETLGSASVVCTDKTGTLTSAAMTVRRVVTASGAVEVDGDGFDPAGAVRDGGAPLDPASALGREVALTLGGGALASDGSVRREDGRWTAVGDPTEAALVVAARKAAGADGPAAWLRQAEAPFTSTRKRMSVLALDPATGRRVLVVKGAPDVLLERCTAVTVGSGSARLAEHLDRVRDELAAMADDALRTLAVAIRVVDAPNRTALDQTADGPEPPTGSSPPPPAALDPDTVAALEEDLTLVGIVGMMDPPRPQAAAAVAEAHRAGIRVAMITGDHPRTARRVADDVGIGGSGVLTGADLDRLDDADLPGALDAARVVARVSPEHKLRIVEALQARHDVVAMTGDGVNDAPALRAADIGVAMGITGTEVSRRAADMVLADDDVATIVAAVSEGRVIVTNIRAFLRYLLSSNIGEVLTVLVGVLAAGLLGLTGHGENVVVPLLATQILWVNLLTDSAPALALGVDRPVEDLMGRPPRRPDQRIIDAAMWRGVLLVGAVMAGVTLAALDLYLPGGLVEAPGAGDLATARTAAFTVLVLAQLVNALAARSESVTALHGLTTNGWLWGAIALSAALQVAVVHVPVLQRAFGTAPLTAGQWLVCVALASVVLVATELRKGMLAAGSLAKRRAPTA